MSPADQWTVLRVLNWTVERFVREGLSSPRLDAEVLLAHALQTQRIRLYMDHDKPLRPEELGRVRELVRRRLGREPVAYLTGTREFWSKPVRVDRRVLVPRPETELLVEVAREILRSAASPLIVDVGTGSGAILLALAGELPGARLIGIDVSPEALAVARENLRELAGRVELFAGDLLEPLPAGARPELIVSNPPYICSADLAGLAPEVRDWEPALALDGGPDGLDVVRRLVPQAAARLAPSGWLAVELGHDQAAAASELMRAAGLEEIRIHKDLAGHDRVLAARLRS
jgi:release factor glutamine methyltransferase